MNHYITAFDVETTGLSQTEDYIIQLSAIRFKKDTYERVKTFNHYIKPIRTYEIKPGAFAAHGLTKEFIEENGVPLASVAGEFIEMFDEKTWDRAKFPLHVREDCSFIEYWSDMEPRRLVPFINMFFNLPMTDINKLFEEPFTGSEHLAKCLKKYYSYHGAKAKNIYIVGRKMDKGRLIEITVYKDIRVSSPSSIKLTFEKR